MLVLQPEGTHQWSKGSSENTTSAKGAELPVLQEIQACLGEMKACYYWILCTKGTPPPKVLIYIVLTFEADWSP